MKNFTISTLKIINILECKFKVNITNFIYRISLLFIVFFTFSNVHSQLVITPYSEDFSRNDGIWTGDFGWSSYSGYYNECTPGSYMASDNIWSVSGGTEFYTSSACGSTLGGDVTINITFQANDYSDPNLYIGFPDFPTLKILTKSSNGGVWVERTILTHPTLATLKNEEKRKKCQADGKLFTLSLSR